MFGVGVSGSSFQSFGSVDGTESFYNLSFANHEFVRSQLRRPHSRTCQRDLKGIEWIDTQQGVDLQWDESEEGRDQVSRLIWGFFETRSNLNRLRKPQRLRVYQAERYTIRRAETEEH